MSDPWVAWSRDVNKRLRDLEGVVLPGKGKTWVLADTLGRIMSTLRREMREANNDVRRGVGLPIVKPRVRRKAGSAPWP
jgi:hypothetical protein